MTEENQIGPGQFRLIGGLGVSLHVEREETMLHPGLDNRGVRLTCYLSNYCDDDLDDVLLAWHAQEEVSISNHFRLSDVVACAIELHEMPAYDGAINEAAKPLFDAMRAELAQMIATIDGLVFRTPNVANNRIAP